MLDAECTAHILERIKEELQSHYKLPSVDRALLMSIQTSSKNDLYKCISNHVGQV
jgi:hypothetical protein